MHGNCEETNLPAARVDCGSDNFIPVVDTLG